MAIHLTQFEVGAFRGIKQLAIPNMNHINILAGDNNCGKTSILESILLLRAPLELSNVIRIARMRNKGIRWNGENPYQSFMTLFPHAQDDFSSQSTLSVSAHLQGAVVSYQLSGGEETVMLDAETMRSNMNPGSPKILREGLPQECLEFQGTQTYSLNDRSHSKEFSFNEFDSIGKFPISKASLFNVVYLSPLDHLEGNLFSHIISNPGYKNLCVSVLQQFDPDIQDLLLLKDRRSGRTVECIEHRLLGTMPLSTYGDGIKKVLSIASGLASARNGILLIDEIETALHAKYYESIFSFIMLASQKFDVQVFITTHSLEAIDSFLAIEDYDQQQDHDDLSIITLKKVPDRSYSRVLSGRRVYENREQFGFEVRL